MPITMNFAQVLWALGIGAAFVAWPIAGKYSGLSGAWINFLILAFSTVAGGVAAFPSLRSDPTPNLKALGIMLLCGVVNGLAVYAYAAKTSDKNMPTAAFMVTTIVLMVALTPIFNWVMNREAFTVSQWGGLAATLLAIYLFTR